jgi:hypothetical protein
VNREHGFRRLTFGVSLLALCAGLALTIHTWYRTQLYLAASVEQQQCMARLTPAQRASEVWEECHGITEARPLPPLVRAALGLTSESMRIRWALNVGGFFDRAVDAVSETVFDRLGAFAVILGILLTCGLVVLPWAAFYFLRWIVGGFRA